MPSSSQWATFLVASFVFIQVPGPSLLFTLGRALTVSPRAARLSVLGNAIGLLTQAVLVAIGVGALVAAGAAALMAMKLVGGAYVMWLGAQAIRHRDEARVVLLSGQHPTEQVSAALTTGFVVGATNPKTVIFLVAFLPQFASTAAPTAPQIALLGLVFASMALASDCVWATLAGRARRWFARRPRRLDTLAVTGGLMMIGLGATLIATE